MSVSGNSLTPQPPWERQCSIFQVYWRRWSGSRLQSGCGITCSCWREREDGRAEIPHSDFGQRKKRFEKPAGKARKRYYLKEEEEELKIVQFLFREFLRLESLTRTAKILLDCGVCTRNGKAYTAAAVRDILTNPVYCAADAVGFSYFYEAGCQMCLEEAEADGTKGFIAYGKTAGFKYRGQENQQDKWVLARGKHRGIIRGEDYVKVQKLLEKNKRSASDFKRVRNETCLLSGILLCSCGSKMRAKYYSAEQKTEKGERKFSYRCPCRDTTHSQQCQNPPIQGNALDDRLWEELLQKTEERLSLFQIFAKAEKFVMIEKSREERQEGVVSEEALPQQKVEEKRGEIKRLTAVLAKWEGEEDCLEPVKEELQSCLTALKALEQKKADRQKQKEQEQFQVHDEETMQIFQSFESLSEMLSVQEKREYLQICVKRVVWDGKTVWVK